MPNLGDMTPEEKRNYLQFLKDMATQQANEGLQGMVGDAQAMEQEYIRNRPDPAAMEAARGTDTAKSHMNMLMAALNAGNGNQGAAQVYGRAAGENPEQDALKNKQGAFMDYLKGLSGLKAQKNALSLPFLQKREAEASEALQGFDQQQAQAQQKAADLAQKAEDKKLSREEREDARRQHAALMRELAAGRLGKDEKKLDQKLYHADPDYEVGQDRDLPEAIRTDLIKSYQGTTDMRKKISDLSKMLADGGRLIMADQGLQKRAKSLATDIQMRLKDPSNYNLGVLAGIDKDLLDTVIPDPKATDLTLWLQLGPELLSQAMSNIEDNYSSKMVGAGYVRKKDAPARGLQPSQAGTVKMKLPSGTIRMIKADSVEAAKKKGAVVVE